MKSPVKLPYQIISREQTSKSLRIKATYRDNVIELFYELKEIKGRLYWFGKISIDGKLYWESPKGFGCETRDVLEAEIQHHLYTWALKRGYISHHKLAP